MRLQLTQRTSKERESQIPKFGLLTDPIQPVPDEIVRFKKLGFDYAEIGIEEPSATPSILACQRKQILELLSINHMFAVGHTAYWVQFGSAHVNARRGWIEEAKAMIRTASLLRLKQLNFHFYGKLGRVGDTERSRYDFLNNFSSAMSELCTFGRSKQVALMLENVPVRENGTGGIGNYSHVMESVPQLNCHLDIAHAFIEGGMSRIETYLKRFSPRLVHIHIHDNHGELDEHLPLRDGNIDFKKVVRWLKKIGYDKTITFEVFTSYKDAVRSREYFRSLWEND